jgi:hypothetical protein
MNSQYFPQQHRSQITAYLTCLLCVCSTPISEELGRPLRRGGWGRAGGLRKGTRVAIVKLAEFWVPDSVGMSMLRVGDLDCITLGVRQDAQVGWGRGVAAALPFQIA